MYLRVYHRQEALVLTGIHFNIVSEVQRSGRGLRGTSGDGAGVEVAEPFGDLVEG